MNDNTRISAQAKTTEVRYMFATSRDKTGWPKQTNKLALRHYRTPKANDHFRQCSLSHFGKWRQNRWLATPSVRKHRDW